MKFKNVREAKKLAEVREDLEVLSIIHMTFGAASVPMREHAAAAKVMCWLERQIKEAQQLLPAPAPVPVPPAEPPAPEVK